MAKKKTTTTIEDEISAKCLAIVDQERVNWEEAVSFITPKVAFRMRELIRILRKNYWGVFDVPVDVNTNREKVWLNLAMATVETWVKNIDMDTKDIGFRALTEEGLAITELTRLVVKQYLDKMYFGETLDADERQCLIDGTVVWKTWQDNSTGKPLMRRRTVDLLNFYIDPTEENIQTAYRVTERVIMPASQLTQMTGWMNTYDLPGSQILNRADGSRRSNFGTRMTGDYRDVWECWGLGPKWLVTKDQKADDANDEIQLHIVVSGLEAPEPTLHLIERNTNKDNLGNTVKPYEEWRAAKISGRWYGLGVVERILALQEYLNTLVNIRINRHYVSQLGLFKIKKGKGITAQMLSRLAENGAVSVTDPDDITPLEFPEDDGTSYKDEETIKYWTSQISSAMPVSNGDIMPSSASATANNLASTSAKSAYTLFKEGMGMFLERWIDRGALPIIAKTVKQGDIIRLFKDDESWAQIVENMSYNIVEKHLTESNVVPTPMELQRELAKVQRELMSKGSIFIQNVQEILAEHLETKVHITNEDLDSSATIQNLFTLLQIPPQLRNDPIVAQIYDLMGLEKPKMTDPTQQQPTPLPGQPQPQVPPSQQTAPVASAATAPGPHSMPTPRPTMQNIALQSMLNR